MPDETRVFDVTRPSHVSPPATSKPVIVGHQPGTSDPMVREESSPFGTEKPSVPEPTKIRVTDEPLQAPSRTMKVRRLMNPRLFLVPLMMP
jgi:hypothetical protein